MVRDEGSGTANVTNPRTTESTVNALPFMSSKYVKLGSLDSETWNQSPADAEALPRYGVDCGSAVRDSTIGARRP
jgi:hypothetical protein